MEMFKRILVCLDLTDIDPTLIEYSSFLAGIAGTEKVFFFHAVQQYDIPRKTSRKMEESHINVERMVREELEETIYNHFPRKIETELITRVEPEDAASSIVDFIEGEQIQLTIIGQKAGEERSGQYGKDVAARAKSHVLFVPEGTGLGIDHILFGSDFSQESEKAFELTLAIAKEADASISCQLLYDTTSSYFPVSSMKITDRMREKWRAQVEEYLHKFGKEPDEVPCTYIEEMKPHDNEAQRTYDRAIENEADFIVISTKGTTTSVTSLLGNISENMRLIEKEMPVLIFKSSLYREGLFQRLFGE